ncbi:hypothetical protein [Paracoccus sp. (in: a-proteobacteria)]|uniref:hypothetical protein n=1 Tax=Paracoccus sp. TaxID=267 RepID=UPI0026DF01AF|nr:hypothetical protein [Paracoccus sp. (in: a-proteobacteria)]MDO5648855.1 hypothetical protein [Paracoccus sp. (in: a-proteobacteria)]
MVLALRDLPLADVRAWADRLAVLEAADDFDGRDLNIEIARNVIEIQRQNGLIPDTPENAPVTDLNAPDAPMSV